MAAKKLSTVTAITASGTGDKFYTLDVSDTTDGAGGSSRAITVDNFTKFVLSPFGGTTPISVTGATTATLNRDHLCTGTSADYTLTLPAVSGNAGAFIGILMGDSTALTKIVTLDGNGSEKIDEALTRAMRANESALLYCDGSGWIKRAGKTIPYSAQSSRVTDQTGISSFTWTAITHTAATGDAAMWDSGNGRLKCVRAGTYIAIAYVYIVPTSGSMTFCYCNNGQTGSPVGAAPSPPVNANQVGSVSCANILTLGTTDYVQAMTYNDATTSKLLGAGGSFLTLLEQSPW